MTAHAVPAATDADKFGLFRVGDLVLALPVCQLREVVPLVNQVALFAEHPAMMGAVDVRGAHVPVLNLQQLLKVESSASMKIVVIMRYQQQLLGLLADEIIGVTQPEAASWQYLQHHGLSHAAMTRGFADADSGTFVSVLEASALLAQSGVVTVAESTLAQATDGLGDRLASGAAFDRQGNHYWLLVSCQNLVLALDTRVVHSTVLDPVVRSDSLAEDFYEGTILFSGKRIPAIRLSAYGQFAATSSSGQQQAFIVQYEQGRVALLVDQILDVVRACPDVERPLPLGSVGRAGLVKTAVETRAVTAAGVLSCDVASDFILRLSSRALQGCKALQSLAELELAEDSHDTTSGGGDAAARAAATSSAGEELLLLDAGLELAVAMNSVIEIVPFTGTTGGFAGDGRICGLIMGREQAIPVLDLTQLLTGEQTRPDIHACVLVTKTNSGTCGFAVQGLTNIVQARWQQSTDVPGIQHCHPSSRVGALREAWQTAGKDRKDGRGLYSVLDLNRVAIEMLPEAAVAKLEPAPEPVAKLVGTTEPDVENDALGNITEAVGTVVGTRREQVQLPLIPGLPAPLDEADLPDLETLSDAESVSDSISRDNGPDQSQNDSEQGTGTTLF